MTDKPVSQVLSEAAEREAIARIIIGPRQPVPDGTTYTLRELQDLRWQHSTTQERNGALWIADCILKRQAPVKMQHVAYYDEGAFHWMSGIAPRDCELFTAALAKEQGR